MAKILLVEDDNNLREIYEARLQAEGYTIVSAKDGEEALAVAKAEKPDLIISDIMMPKVSGFEMLDILKNTAGLQNTKVIMLTALGQSDDQQRADKLGADKYLVKSQVTLEDIVKAAHDLLADDAGVTPAAPTPTADPTPPPAGPADPPAADPPAADPPTPIQPVTPEPVTPAPSDDPPATSASVSGQSSDDTQSTTQEEANVEAKIENFVAGAEPESEEVKNQTNNDQVLATAASALSSDDAAPSPGSSIAPKSPVSPGANSSSDSVNSLKDPTAI
jgi:CheY-like chemotaxis protein